MNKEASNNDLNHSWPDLKTSKNKSIHLEQPIKYPTLSKATISSNKPEVKKTNTKLQQNRLCKSEDTKQPSIGTKDLGPNPTNLQHVKEPQTKSSVFNGICGYWDRIEEINKQDQNQIVSQIKDLNLNSSITDPKSQQMDSQDSKTWESLTREEIVMQRKLKVAERRQVKKQEKRQLKAIVSGIQVAKPDFSLEKATDDFPALNSGKKYKKVKKSTNGNSLLNATENQIIEKGIFVKPVEKSWKPKIKDPINIDISQALLTVKSEKPMPVIKKVNPSTKRNVPVGNLLDSDHPEMKKGKVRPNKVPRPTKLKSLILSERNARRKSMFGETDIEKTLFTKENDQATLIKASDFKIDIIDEMILSRNATLRSGLENKPEINVENVEKLGTSTVIPLIPGIHSRRFREYCTNCLTEKLTSSVCSLLTKVAEFQDRSFARNPIKANAKRRYVAGINQTKKYLLVKKVKLLVIAPDLEKCPGQGALDEIIHHFIMEAQSQDIPCVFGPSRKQLGKTVFKHSVSSVAVLSYDGAQDLFTKVQEGLSEAQDMYQNLIRKSGGFVPVKDEETDSSVAVKEMSSTERITSALLATLRGEVTPADKLLKAIEGCGW